MGESALTKKIRARITEIGGRSIKLHSGAAQGSGEPDVIACLPGGQMLVVEVKVPGQRPRAIQRWALIEWAKVGAVAIDVTSVEEFNTKLEVSGWDRASCPKGG